MISELLKNNVVKVRFTKRDGSIRDMLATQQRDLVPVTRGRKLFDKPGLLTVFDVEIQQWRSFYEDSVISYEVN